MDERLIQLKARKKQYKKERWRKAWFWQTLFIFLTVLAALAVGVLLFVLLYKTPAVRFIDLCLWENVKAALGLKWNFPLIGRAVAVFGPPAVLLLAALWALSWLLWRKKVARTRKLDSYLDWQTLKTTLKAEKEEA